MLHHVTGKQPNSKMCFVCGLKNLTGLRTSFYELENGELLATIKTNNEHQSYPGIMHGGIAAAVLDETIGRAILIKYKEPVWGVTIEFSMRFKKAIPLENTLRVVGRITRDSGKLFEGTGEILLPDGSIAAEGKGKYFKKPIGDIADFDFEAQEWRVVDLPDDPKEVEI
jgi:acyl-coenzyme A thioesterase PaaI-like protein